MKKIMITMAMAVILAACANKNTVNILISNHNTNDTTNVIVHVPVEKILLHIDTQNVDSLILLNEKNQPVDFTVTHGNQDIEFVVPIIKAHSQKNYSLNTSNAELRDNLFSFRTTSISVNLEAERVQSCEELGFCHSCGVEIGALRAKINIRAWDKMIKKFSYKEKLTNFLCFCGQKRN